MLSTSVSFFLPSIFLVRISVLNIMKADTESLILTPFLISIFPTQFFYTLISVQSLSLLFFFPFFPFLVRTTPKKRVKWRQWRQMHHSDHEKVISKPCRREGRNFAYLDKLPFKITGKNRECSALKGSRSRQDKVNKVFCTPVKRLVKHNS